MISLRNMESGTGEVRGKRFLFKVSLLEEKKIVQRRIRPFFKVSINEKQLRNCSNEIYRECGISKGCQLIVLEGDDKA